MFEVEAVQEDRQRSNQDDSNEHGEDESGNVEFGELIAVVLIGEDAVGVERQVSTLAEHVGELGADAIHRTMVCGGAVGRCTGARRPSFSRFALVLEQTVVEKLQFLGGMSGRRVVARALVLADERIALTCRWRKAGGGVFVVVVVVVTTFLRFEGTRGAKRVALDRNFAAVIERALEPRLAHEVEGTLLGLAELSFPL